MLKYVIQISVLVFFSCSNNLENENIYQVQNINEYIPISICKCNEDGIKSLKKAIKLRKNFKELEEYQNNARAIKTMNIVKKNWSLVRDKCMMKFGAQLFVPSNCNDLEKIGKLREQLDQMGIRTS